MLPFLQILVFVVRSSITTILLNFIPTTSCMKFSWFELTHHEAKIKRILLKWRMGNVKWQIENGNGKWNFFF